MQHQMFSHATPVVIRVHLSAAERCNCAVFSVFWKDLQLKMDWRDTDCVRS